MRRVMTAILAVLVIVAILLLVRSCGDDADAYKVRAVFDNGGFVVPGVDVRVAGAYVGSVDSVDVSMPGEDVTGTGADDSDPGKAIVIMNITDKGFQDFRDDASCIIRPQSLIGEKFVDCSVTEPRAPGTEAPPALAQVPDGQPGAGQFLLPIENNAKSVDLDLINNIYRLPYAQRFRIILNELGAGLASRGPELNETITRANPTLLQVNKVLEKLSSQNKRLAQLARDGDNNLTPLAEKRKNMIGFFESAGFTAAATAERGEDLQANLRNLPGTLRELRKNFDAIGTFADAGTPVFASLLPNVDQISEVQTKLGPFADATRTSLLSLGRATRTAGPDLVASRPVIRRLGKLSRVGESPATDLNFLLASTRQSDGFNNLMRVFYNSATILNPFDANGHFQRTNLLVSGCTTYSGRFDATCRATWPQSVDGATSAIAGLPDLQLEDGLESDSLTGPSGATGLTGVTGVTGSTGATSDGSDAEDSTDGTGLDQFGDGDGDGDGTTGTSGETGLDNRSAEMRGRMQILDYLMGQ